MSGIKIVQEDQFHVLGHGSKIINSFFAVSQNAEYWLVCSEMLLRKVREKMKPEFEKHKEDEETLP